MKQAIERILQVLSPVDTEVFWGGEKLTAIDSVKVESSIEMAGNRSLDGSTMAFYPTNVAEPDKVTVEFKAADLMQLRKLHLKMGDQFHPRSHPLQIVSISQGVNLWYFADAVLTKSPLLDVEIKGENSTVSAVFICTNFAPQNTIVSARVNISSGPLNMGMGADVFN